MKANRITFDRIKHNRYCTCNKEYERTPYGREILVRETICNIHKGFRETKHPEPKHQKIGMTFAEAERAINKTFELLRKA